MGSQDHGRTLSEIAALVGGELHGDGDKRITRPVPAGFSDPDGITFAENDAYLKKALAVKVGAVLVSEGMTVPGVPYVVCKIPRLAFGQILHLVDRPLPLHEGIHPTAVVSPKASVDATAQIGPFSVVEAGSYVGPHVRIYPFSYVGENCYLSASVVVLPHAVLVKNVRVGKGAIIHSGSVLGSDGFGFFWDGSAHQKVPQVGDVVVGEHAEIGSNTCIDRATCGETQIGRGTKIDNLVQVAHNVQIGTDSVIAGQTGIAGSAIIGDRFACGGQVAVSDHAEVGNDINVAGRSGIAGELKEAGNYFGSPIMPARQGLRVYKMMTRLPELLDRIRSLEEEVERLKDK